MKKNGVDIPASIIITNSDTIFSQIELLIPQLELYISNVRFLLLAFVLLEIILPIFLYYNKYINSYNRASGIVKFLLALFPLLFLIVAFFPLWILLWKVIKNIIIKNYTFFFILILIILYAIPTIYDSCKKCKNANEQMIKFQKKAMEEKIIDEARLTNELEKFQFYTTGIFYVDVLRSSSDTIILFSSSYIIISISIEMEAVMNILACFYILFVYWLIMWLAFLEIIIQYPEGILTSPGKKFRENKIKSIVKKIQNAQNSSNKENTAPQKETELNSNEV